LATEMFSSANKAFTMCPGLTQGAVEAIHAAASDELKATWLPKMITGEWTGTMNLTEPQAGSDVGAIRTKATPQADGSYRIKGQKIFISFGEHDMAENIVHLVLARTPDAPEGVRGISLFLVPKFLLNEDGSIGQRNDLICSALEHKLGIHASPTAVMSFGDNDGAVGYLVGDENKGLAAMFVMMNMARLAVGIEGVASAESALQLATAYAHERRQGSLPTNPTQSVVIAEHADVRRMLMLMQSRTRAMRAMAMVIAEAQDVLDNSSDAQQRQQKQQFIELMIPVFKAWATESGIDVASLGLQIHGGMGYVEETGAAQIWRDARISTIYEGTTGIQANDLIGRKLMRDSGEAFGQLMSQIRATVADMHSAGLSADAQRLEEAVAALEASAALILKKGKTGFMLSQFVSVPFLMMMGHVTGGWLLARCAVAAQSKKDSGEYAESELTSWLQTQEFYSRYTLAEVAGMQRQLENYLGEEANASLPDIAG
ncbi:MAG: acyl-CoA dehydrogenase, partial [Oceanobacter sp.]